MCASGASTIGRTSPQYNICFIKTVGHFISYPIRIANVDRTKRANWKSNENRTINTNQNQQCCSPVVKVRQLSVSVIISWITNAGWTRWACDILQLLDKEHLIFFFFAIHRRKTNIFVIPYYDWINVSVMHIDRSNTNKLILWIKLMCYLFMFLIICGSHLIVNDIQLVMYIWTQIEYTS